MESIKGKTAVITGASRGIGKAIAAVLAGEGMNLVLNSRNPEALEKAKAELSGTGVEILLCPGDMADVNTPPIIIENAIRHFGRLDVLINNAAIAVPNPVSDITPEEWDRHMAINARAPYLMCREALQWLQKSDAASIINIASVVGTKGYVNQAAYTASKHALMGFTKVLAQELHSSGTRVHVLSPGGVATDMVARMRPDLDTSELITPGEIADIVLFLLTHRGNAVIDEINIHRASNSPWK